jgi:hypothetical protein
MTQRWVTSLVLATLTACSGTSAPVSPPAADTATTRQPARFQAGHARLIVGIPNGTAAKSLEVSAATMDPGIVIISRIIDLRPASPDCTRAKDATLCTIVVQLNPGRWLGTVESYDHHGAKGRKLGEATRGFRMETGTTTVHLTIGPPN